MGFLPQCFKKKGFPPGSESKESSCNVGDLGSTPGLGRSPGEGNSYPHHYSSLESSTDCIVHGVVRVGHNGATFSFALKECKEGGVN